MNTALASITARLPRLDRDFLAWGVVPAMAAALVTGLFAVPNYLRALSLQDDAQRLQAVSAENISQRNNLQYLEANVAKLRSDRDRRCRPLADQAERDRLLAAITRPTDGTAVHDQSIRTGTVAAHEIPGSDLRVQRRTVDVDMTGTFDAVFGVIDAAADVDQLVTPRVIEITVLGDPIQLAQSATPAVRATMVLDEWFEAPPAPAAVPAEKAGGR